MEGSEPKLEPSDAWDLPKPRALSRHDNECTKKNCLMCVWHAQGSAWCRSFRLPLGNNGHSGKTWVAARADGPTGFRFGCVACHRDKENGITRSDSWTDFRAQARKSFALRRHHISRAHLAAARRYVGATNNDVSLHAAKATLRTMQQGRSCRDKDSSSDRTSLLRWCVSEGVLDHYRGFLATAKSIVLMRDERNSRILVRFAAANEKLQTLAGVMGLVKDRGSSNAEAILQATVEIMERFCTKLGDAPRNTCFKGAAALVRGFLATSATRWKSW